MIVVSNFSEWVEPEIRTLRCSDITKAYIVSVFTEQVTSPIDMSADSIVLKFAAAREKSDFVLHKSLGDWVLWVDSTHSSFFNEDRELVHTIARLSYISCHRMLHGKWALYEELADELPVITHHLKRSIGRSWNR